jgi:hypothetical protein
MYRLLYACRTVQVALGTYGLHPIVTYVSASSSGAALLVWDNSIV